jgi:hypothetical protein
MGHKSLNASAKEQATRDRFSKQNKQNALPVNFWRLAASLLCFKE